VQRMQDMQSCTVQAAQIQCTSVQLWSTQLSACKSSGSVVGNGWPLVFSCAASWQPPEPPQLAEHCPQQAQGSQEGGGLYSDWNV